jgi:alpha-1,2-mannosyltransferase
VPLLFVTGKRAAAARALAVFAGLQVLALVIAPRDSAYWTSCVFKTDRSARRSSRTTSRSTASWRG